MQRCFGHAAYCSGVPADDALKPKLNFRCAHVISIYLIQSWAVEKIQSPVAEPSPRIPQSLLAFVRSNCDP